MPLGGYPLLFGGQVRRVHSLPIMKTPRPHKADTIEQLSGRLSGFSEPWLRREKHLSGPQPSSVCILVPSAPQSSKGSDCYWGTAKVGPASEQTPRVDWRTEGEPCYEPF